MTPRKSDGRGARKRKDVSLRDMHDAAQMVEGFLRKGIETEELVRAVSKIPPKKLILVGLRGLIRALERDEG